MTCDVCRGEKKIRVATFPDVEPESGDGMLESPFESQSSKEFDCPQCCMVPYRRVRAMKVSTAYPPEVFSKAQAPIERGLAARFGEYLYREGLIKFTTAGSEDFGFREEKITVTAHLGVVTREDVKRAGAEAEIALTKAPPLPESVRRRLNAGNGARRWQPPDVEISFPDREALDEFEEPKDAIANRFSGLEI